MLNKSKEGLVRSPETSVGLHGLGLKRVDVVVFSRMYLKDDATAAKDLIELGVDGREIRHQRGIAPGRPSRLEIAREYFVENVGEPTSAVEKAILRKAKKNRFK